MVEWAGLENRCTLYWVPRVRIPPSPPIKKMSEDIFFIGRWLGLRTLAEGSTKRQESRFGPRSDPQGERHGWRESLKRQEAVLDRVVTRRASATDGASQSRPYLQKDV